MSYLLESMSQACLQINLFWTKKWGIIKTIYTKEM